MRQIELDKFDVRILDELQRDAHASNSAISDLVHLSPSQVSRRIQRLEQIGLVDRYVALLDPSAAGLGVTAFMSVSLERHGGDESEAFNESVQALGEVLECHAVTGEADYLLRVVAFDLASLSEFMMHSLLRIPGVRSVKSNVVLQEIKRTTRLPLGHFGHPPVARKASGRKRMASR